MNNIKYKQVTKDELSIYSTISMQVSVNEIYEIYKVGKGMNGINYQFEKKGVTPYFIDFTDGDSKIHWGDSFDISNWAFFLAFDGEKAVGGVAVASKTDEVRMLEGRNDITALWDLRVANEYKHIGIGNKLFEMACAWSKQNGL